MALGSYPAVSLADARKARDIARLQKGEGKNPVALRKVAKLRATVSADESVRGVALEWFAKQKTEWSDGHSKRLLRQLERDIFPHIGSRRVREVEPMELLAVLQKIEYRGAFETADRALMVCRQVWTYAIATSKAERDVTVGLKDALVPYRGKHFAAITDPQELAVLLRAIDAYKGGVIVRSALRLAPLLFQRPGELRAAAWAEVDLAASMWTIPASRMKRQKSGKEQGEPHLVPLPLQAVEILHDLQRYTGHGKLVFPGERDHERPISENSVRTALISMGYTSELQTWHGFRATARTMLDEQLGCDPLVIEAQLAHAVRDANGRAYNRTTYLKQRTQMMQLWADYLDELRRGDVQRIEEPVQVRRSEDRGAVNRSTVVKVAQVEEKTAALKPSMTQLLKGAYDRPSPLMLAGVEQPAAKRSAEVVVPPGQGISQLLNGSGDRASPLEIAGVVNRKTR